MPLPLGVGIGVSLNTTPDAPTIDLHLDSDSGDSSSDNITSDTTPAFTVTAAPGWAFEAGDTITNYVDEVAQNPHVLTTEEIIADAFYSGTDPLVAGTYDFQYSHTRNGFESPLSSAISVTIITDDPIISDLDPLDGGTSDFDAGTILTATFNRDIALGTGTVTLIETPSTIVETYDVATGVGSEGGTIEADGPDLVITTGVAMTSSAAHAVQIEFTCVDDLAGNSFLGIEDLLTWNFTTITGTTPTQWNANDAAASLTLNVGSPKLTVTKTSSDGIRAAIRSVGFSAGKKYYEVRLVETSDSGNMRAGIANSSYSLSTTLGGQQHSVAWDAFGSIYINNSAVSSVNSFQEGDTLCFAIDFDAELMWVRRSRAGVATNWNNNASANPATGTGPAVDISGLAAGPYYAAVQTRTTSPTQDQWVANFGATAYAQTAPAGFDNWTQ